MNKSENERSGVLSTAMSFLGLYRDPTVAAVTAACDWRIEDLTSAKRPLSLYLVVPPSDISRTKPLIRLVLNQIGRRLTQRLQPANLTSRQLLMMLDEFPALGRLDFFETALAFMAGYGIRAFLIAQSLNQIEKAYGEHNSILDNCHVRVAFASNDERTAKRISDALGTATQLRAMRNYAGHRLAPWLAHVMVSRQETARPLLTPGEVMQLSASDELVLVSGMPPIRAQKLRYFEDRQFKARKIPAPVLTAGDYPDRPPQRPHDWENCLAETPDADSEPVDVARGDGFVQERAPELPANAAHKAGDAPNVGEDLDEGQDELAVADPLLSRAVLAPVIAADGIDQGADRGDDVVPGF